jgi:thiamine-phosphate pyrophosphorylase
MLQFITNSSSVNGTIKQALQALNGGCRWVQVRMKDADDNDVMQAVSALLPRFNAENAKLLIDDRVQLVAKLGAHGVHLGHDDMSPSEAREILGPNSIIGYTVNNIEHARNALSLPIDYIGMGPWRFTTTKKKLAPVLGADGIHELINFLRENNKNIPVVAIGGITVDDVAEVLLTGASGVAISGEIANSATPELQTKLFIDTLHKYTKNGK